MVIFDALTDVLFWMTHTRDLIVSIRCSVCTFQIVGSFHFGTGAVLIERIITGGELNDQI